jgi:hypothetical protein
MNLLKSKRSQGEVVATVLLILLSISAVIIIINFVVPFVRDRLDKSCFDYNGMIEIKNDEKYTCFHKGTAPDYNRLLIRVVVGDLDENDVVPLNGFEVVVNKEGEPQQRFRITKTEVTPAGKVSAYAGAITIPGRNAERTYNLSLPYDEKPNSTIIYPLLENGKECSEAKYELDFFPNC